MTLNPEDTMILGILASRFFDKKKQSKNKKLMKMLGHKPKNIGRFLNGEEVNLTILERAAADFFINWAHGSKQK